MKPDVCRAFFMGVPALFRVCKDQIPATPSGFRLHAVPASIPHATRLQINCIAAIVQHSGFQFSIPFSPVKHLA
jgi:hypothetical protein